jgi:hypothetical protein
MANYTNRQLALLPELPFAPEWPNPKSLPGEALARMLAGERLTQPSFGLHFWRLSAYIGRLKTLGWPVERADVSCPPGYGAGGAIAAYWLPPEIIAEAKAMRP